MQFAIPYLFASITVKEQLKQFAQATFISCTLFLTEIHLKELNHLRPISENWPPYTDLKKLRNKTEL